MVGKADLFTTGKEDKDLLFSSLDLTDAFYQLGWTGMSSYFCLDIQVRAGDFGISQVYDELTGEYEAVGEDDLIFPALAVLPIGFSWPLLFCHGLLTEAMLEAMVRRSAAWLRPCLRSPPSWRLT